MFSMEGYVDELREESILSSIEERKFKWRIIVVV